MAFYFKGYDNRGYYTHIPSALAVVELFQDSITVPWNITVPNISYVDIAIVEAADIWASTPSTITTFLDMAVVGPVDDVFGSSTVILDDVALAAVEAIDVFAGAIPVVLLTADLDVTDDDDVWGSAVGVSAGMALATTDRTDVFLGGAFVGYFFLPEQEILYVKGEHTVMHVPANQTAIHIAAKPEELGPRSVDTGMITKKRNRSRLQ
jgi:hypothetical protein